MCDKDILANVYLEVLTHRLGLAAARTPDSDITLALPGDTRAVITLDGNDPEFLCLSVAFEFDDDPATIDAACAAVTARTKTAKLTASATMSFSVPSR